MYDGSGGRSLAYDIVAFVVIIATAIGVELTMGDEVEGLFWILRAVTVVRTKKTAMEERGCTGNGSKESINLKMNKKSNTSKYAVERERKGSQGLNRRSKSGRWMLLLLLQEDLM